MSPFLSGALGAAALLLVLGAARRLAFRRFRHGGPGRGRFVLRRLFRRLGTRPEQESLITGEVEAFWAELRGLREDGPALRGELAELLAAEVIDEATVSAVLKRRADRLEGLREKAAASIARIHGALDGRQRALVAELVRRGPPFGHGRHAQAHGRC